MLQKQLIEYWQTLLEPGQLIPERKKLDPTKILPLLPKIILIERFASDDYRLRLMGTHLETIYGPLPIGFNILELVAVNERKQLDRFYGEIVAFGCGLETVREVLSPTDKTHECLFTALPLIGSAPERPQFILLVDFLNFEYKNVRDSRLELGKLIRGHYIDMGNGLPDMLFGS